MEVQISGIHIEQNHEAVIISSERPLAVLSSAIVGGGLTITHSIVNYRVNKEYFNNNPAYDLEAYAHRQSLPNPFVGLMTAAWVHKAQRVFLQESGLTVGVSGTAGLSNATSAGVSLPFAYQSGTINLILLVDGNLSQAAMVNAVITATEAKVDFLRTINARTTQGDLATGTSTDSVAIACTGRGECLPYAGPATVVGWLIGRCVRDVLGKLWDDKDS
jgi:adenosylcobinamide hydrolase